MKKRLELIRARHPAKIDAFRYRLVRKTIELISAAKAMITLANWSATKSKLTTVLSSRLIMA